MWTTLAYGRFHTVGAVFQGSVLHENWSLEAGGNWDSAAGQNCERLADILHKGLDAVSAGYEVQIPSDLRNVRQ